LSDIDPLVDIAQLTTGDSFLDCTLGLGSDAIVASVAVGKLGTVIGLEQSKVISYLVKKGLKNWSGEQTLLEQAMRRINVCHIDHLSYLKKLKDHSIEVVYFDPMFSESIISSNGIHALKTHALYNNQLVESVKEAKRVAKKRVIMKDHYRSKRFEELGFTREIRPSSKQHYGYIEV